MTDAKENLQQLLAPSSLGAAAAVGIEQVNFHVDVE
jgi:hypothetical protein